MLFTSPRQRVQSSIYHEVMKEKINAYFAVLLITIAGGSAALLIVHIATSDTIAIKFSGSEANYLLLKQSILKNKAGN